MSDRNRHRNFEDYLEYLRNHLSGRERHAFERDLESDPFKREAMEGFEMFARDDIEADMASLRKRLSRRIKRRRRITLYSAAAAVASLLIVSTIFVKLHDFNPEEASKEITERSGEKGTPVIAPGDIQENVVPEETSEEETIPERTGEGTGQMEIKDKIGTAEKELPGQAEMKKSQPADEQGKSEVLQYIKQEPVQEIRVVEERVKAGGIEQPAKNYEQPILADETRSDVITVVEAGKEVEKTDERVALPVARSREPLFQVTSSKSISEESQPGLKSIRGLVISLEDSMPVPGATVMIKGTTKGAITDTDGRFNMAYAGDTSPTLIASFIGMEQKEFTVKDDSNITLAMNPDLSALSEVVVIGYGVYGDQRAETVSVSEVAMRNTSPAGSYTAPLPEGGNDAFKTYVEENMQFPEGHESLERAVVILRFTVKTDGSIDDIQVLRTAGQAFTDEAKRVLLEGPDWLPAEKEGMNFEERVRIKLVFKK
ncbi:MAG: carboxypeptidase-like regulatory domain-containing protein [Bacteroidales bacterium]|nr:carboxypeptidase-like regulatory domain-containing protein [Bacteroidales bacterium]MBN2699541.1 carboxypeptidase-like regulatory domain-containing protein [Bacteroidales bacterium]